MFDVDEKLIRQLSDLMAETDLAEIELEKEGQRIRVSRGLPPQANFALPPVAAASSEASAPATASAASPDHPGAVKSPMVGTVYMQPEPGAAPFIQEGQQVHEGQILFIIEAMKVMNQIKAPSSGVIKKIMIEDAQPVEYGEVLLIIE